MGLYGMMRTGVSGMAAQSNRLSAVADNIANSSTNGYKRAQAEFSSLVLPSSGGSYNSGGVTTSIRYAISQSGPLQYTTSGTDLAIEGGGFFVVQDSSGQPFLTRAGSFVPNAEGELVNAAGYKLMGYSYASGVPAVTANGYAGLEAVVIAQSELVATPSRNGTLTANLPSSGTAVAAADLPSANAATATYSHKTSLVAYDNLGGKKLLDVYMTKTGPDTWEVAVYDRADAAPNTSFPYANPALATTTLTFDPANGKLDGTSPTDITLTVPGGDALTLDLSSVTQLDTGFTVTGNVDGSAPYSIDSVEIGADGTIYAQYADGSMRALYRIPIADVQSPDRLQVITGNVFSESADSGGVQLGFPGEGGMGKVVSGALESSNVDIAQELTDMIEAQRNYTANSKVFQTGSDLMELLVNLKR
ncbi:flagellar hook protein FlgE [Nitratireductor sp. ZSWI3]|uniref:flagellar hook protein FlgE n=1 Tax=Nitratireductor sp. ZSWI3 TaxID=2966359 RepID=UPI00214FB35A|nr:flagellar hook protein FlgE [Nitratireductor sp. ZSWI3]MCR4264804.1 flagellar hook protein FlgE [Nitratireductor sp. ZSWI3]